MNWIYSKTIAQSIKLITFLEQAGRRTRPVFMAFLSLEFIICISAPSTPVPVILHSKTLMGKWEQPVQRLNYVVSYLIFA